MKQNHTSKTIEEADIMMHACNFGTKEAEVERSHGLGQLVLWSLVLPQNNKTKPIRTGSKAKKKVNNKIPQVLISSA